MKYKSGKSQNILSAIKRVEKSLKFEIIKTDLRAGERTEKSEESLKEEIRKTRDDLMTKMDGIAKGLEDMRDENTAGADLIRGLEVKVDDHEERITKLESPAA